MTKQELEERVKELEHQLRLRDGMQTYGMSGSIFDAMVDAKLDPKEAFEFFRKYGEFLRFGIINKQVQVQGSLEYLEANKDKAFYAGSKCFESFLEDFSREYQVKSVQGA